MPACQDLGECGPLGMTPSEAGSPEATLLKGESHFGRCGALTVTSTDPNRVLCKLFLLPV